MSVQIPPRPESRASLRAQCAVVAQYIRELSSSHRRDPLPLRPVAVAERG